MSPLACLHSRLCNVTAVTRQRHLDMMTRLLLYFTPSIVQLVNYYWIIVWMFFFCENQKKSNYNRTLLATLVLGSRLIVDVLADVSGNH